MKHLIIFLTTVILFSACNKDDAPPVPELTPESSLSMDFSFTGNEKSAPLLIKNWTYSTARITIFSAINLAYMTVPALAYAAAFQETPSYIGNMTWQWNYSFFALGVEYQAKLNGTTDILGLNTSWQMFISTKEMNNGEEFLWFEGETQDQVAAAWTVYANPNDPYKVLSTKWEYDTTTENAALKYTYFNANDDNNNSTISFTNSTESVFNRSYNIYLSSIENEINIEWSSEFHNGRVKSENHYGDTEWHCWSERLLDEDCN